MGIFDRINNRINSDKKELIVNDGKLEWVTYEEKIQWVYEKFFEHGDECDMIFSEEVISGKNPLLNAITTAGFGLPGLAYSMPTMEHRKHSGKIKVAEKGLVLTISTIEMRRNIKIPWNFIVNAERNHKGFVLNLVDDDVIVIQAGHGLFKRYEEFRLLVIDYINSKASGIVEEGWD